VRGTRGRIVPWEEKPAGRDGSPKAEIRKKHNNIQGSDIQHPEKPKELSKVGTLKRPPLSQPSPPEEERENLSKGSSRSEILVIRISELRHAMIEW